MSKVNLDALIPRENFEVKDTTFSDESQPFHTVNFFERKNG